MLMFLGALVEEGQYNSREQLTPQIKNYIPSGSIIMTDKWPAYNKLNEEGYEHGSVNHRKELVSSEDEDHRQTIWSASGGI